MSVAFIQSEMFEQEFDSREEALFSSYLSELKNAGFIKAIEYQPKSFVLTEDLFVHAFEQKRDYNKPTNIKLARGAEYTADFKIEWNKSAHSTFYWLQGNDYPTGFYPYRKAKASAHIPFFARLDDDSVPVTWVDVKGTFSNAHGLAKFSIIQKWLETKETFIQKVVVSLDEKSIFAKTFTPRVIVANEVYQKDCKHGKKGESKLKFEPRLLEHYLKWRKL
jgi:hypothetical protein